MPLRNYTNYFVNSAIDHYYDTVEGHYYQEGIFIRIRNHKSLDIKFNPDHLGKKSVQHHVVCHEYNFEEPFSEGKDDKWALLQTLTGLQKPSGTTFKSFLSENSLKPLLTLDKVRESYEKKPYIIDVDTIKDVGMFLEV